MNTDLHFSSANDEWTTPLALFEELDKEFGFHYDVCAHAGNHLTAVWFGPGSPFAEDALTAHWGPSDGGPDCEPTVCFMNPPYSKEERPCKPRCKKKTCAKRGYHRATYKPGAEQFVERAYLHARSNWATTVCLLAARTDVRWFHRYCWDAAKHAPRPGVEVRFLEGRLTFGTDPKADPAPFPSVIVVFRAGEVL